MPAPKTVATVTQVPSVTISITHHMWWTWANIAVDEERRAWVARKRATINLAKDGNPRGAMSREMRASVGAVTGASHCLDAIYGEVKWWIERKLDPKLIAAWNRNKPARHKRILETLKFGYQLRGYVTQWQKEFVWLYDLRDPAIHPQVTTTPAAPHPTGTNTAREYATYTAEAASRAVDIMLEVLTLVADPERWKIAEELTNVVAMPNLKAVIKRRALTR